MKRPLSRRKVRTMLRKTLISLVAAMCVFGIAGTALADATTTHTFRWDKTHAVRTYVWYDNDVWADMDGNGWDDTLTYTVYFRVRNIDTRGVSGSCVVKSVVDAIGGPDVTRHTQTFSFTAAPGQTSPDQSFVVGPVSIYENDQDVYSDEWVASCTWHGIRLRA
jgi:hypothetical protein